MKCPNPSCNMEIPKEAAFCPNCGTVIQQTSGVNNNDSSFSAENEYHFIPTTVAQLKPLFASGLLLYSLLVILSVILWVPSKGFTLFITIPLLIIGFFFRYLARLFPMWFVHKKLCKMADYIQDPLLFRKERYILIKKDGKLGLFNQELQKVQLPSIYETMSWDMKDRTLDVQKDGESVKIDIFGNILK